MINKELLEAQMGPYEADLREYRLTGDMQYLVAFIHCVCNAATEPLARDFSKALTDNEKKAFQAITEEIGLSGNISVVKMIQKTNLSRPVFTSLLQKMEKYGIAQIKNQGVKGTYIELHQGVEI